MSIGWRQLQAIKNIEKEAWELGFQLIRSRYYSETNEIGLIPRDAEALPVYARDAEIFSGTLNDIHKYLMGIKWARDYDRMLRVSTPTQREKKEQQERNKQLMKVIKES